MLYQFIRDHQLNIMLGMSSICFMVGFFAMITKALPKRRKWILVDIEFSSGLLLFSDRLAYMYHGNVSDLGYYMVRISNFMVFFMTISVVHVFNLYLTDLCRNEVGMKKIPNRLRIVELITAAGWFFVILSQFTGLYYTFNANNEYQRGPGFVICYTIPFLALFIQLSVIFQLQKKLSLYIWIPLLLFTVIPMVASVIQAFFYGVSLTNMAIVGMGVVLYIFALLDLNEKLEKTQKSELDAAQNYGMSVFRSFDQTSRALIGALDAKDKYTREHSKRVAEYARLIAKAMGMDDIEAAEIGYSALFHDVGKIAIPDQILKKRERLTEEESAILKKHPVYGKEIMSGVTEIPYLKPAAAYHHERYDGKGYPEGLKGEAIPLAARITAVADAYDKMASFKYGRPPLAQGKIREEILSEAGKAFDPKIVSIMVDMIDKDTDYALREADDDSVDEADINDITKVDRMHFENYKDRVSDGIRITDKILKLHFESRPINGHEKEYSLPVIILFDSFDRCVHRNPRNIKNLHYFEYGEIWLDGHTVCTSARDIKAEVTEKETGAGTDANGWETYDIEIFAVKDHVMLIADSNRLHIVTSVALPDSTRFVQLGLAGEQCDVKNIKVIETDIAAKEEDVIRIAPEVSFFSRKDGDIPNLEVDDYREVSTEGIPVEDGMRIFFRSKSLPVANLVHHCSYVVLFSSDDGLVTGNNYEEYACIRLDGEDATYNGKAEISLSVHKDEKFLGWDNWKEINLVGLDYEVDFKRKRNRVVFSTENAGISIECHVIVPKGVENVYAALTGNLCTLMNIRIR